MTGGAGKSITAGLLKGAATACVIGLSGAVAFVAFVAPDRPEGDLADIEASLGTADERVQPAGTEPSQSEAQPQPETAATSDDEAPKETAPSFDVVRVEPDGSVLIAGRAAPRASVEVLVDASVIAGTEADGGGTFVVLTDIEPAPVPRIVSLVARLGDGPAIVSSETAILAPSGASMPPPDAVPPTGMPEGDRDAPLVAASTDTPAIVSAEVADPLPGATRRRQRRASTRSVVARYPSG